MLQRALLISSTLLALAAPAGGYPLDGFPETGITRLEAYRLAATTAGRPDFLTEGEMMPTSSIVLALAGRDLSLPEPDPALSTRIEELLGGDAPNYGVAVLDWTDPERPRYASVHPGRAQIPGSVGKVMVLLGWFQALADVYPDDVDARRRVLRDTQIVADGFIRNDQHDVPVWNFGDDVVDRRPIAEGERASLWTYLDWMASASSNAAASMLIKELLLLKQFGPRYPVPAEEAEAWLSGASAQELRRALIDAIVAPGPRNGLDSDALRQGSLFTREGKNRVAGSGSTATAEALVRYVLQMEQGALVDEWSSLEIKKLLYLTDKRIRYASHPVLDDSAIYFKSGSLYGCKPERRFTCGKFRGNRINLMNSVVVVETPGEPVLRYAVVVLSNVLRRDSSELHQQLGYDIHRLIESLHRGQPSSPPVVPDADAAEGSPR